MDIIYIMAFSSFSTIHNMIHYNKKNVSTPFSGSVQLLSMAGETSSSISSNWMSINGTGNYLIAVSYLPNSKTYLSSNAGATWTKINSSPIVDNLNFRQAWISRDGVYRVYSINCTTIQSSGYVYSTSNLGISYDPTPIKELQGAFVSDDGNVKLVSVYGGQLFRIVNSPSSNTFIASVSTSMLRGHIKGSSSGQYLLNYTTSSYMQFSNDYGANWSQLSVINGLTGSTSSNMVDMAISGDGQYMIIAGTGYKLWKTSNYGVNWTTISGSNTLVNGLPNTNTYTTENSWSGCTASKTGQYMSVAGYFTDSGTFQNKAYVFISSDYGSSWTSKLIPLSITNSDPGILTSTMSYNDAGVPIKIFIATYGNGIYYINF